MGAGWAELGEARRLSGWELDALLLLLRSASARQKQFHAFAVKHAEFGLRACLLSHQAAVRSVLTMTVCFYSVFAESLGKSMNAFVV